MEGRGRGLIKGTMPAFAWRDWENPRKTSVTTYGLRAEIWKRDFRNMKLDVNHSSTAFGQLCVRFS